MADHPDQAVTSSDGGTFTLSLGGGFSTLTITIANGTTASAQFNVADAQKLADYVEDFAKTMEP